MNAGQSQDPYSTAGFRTPAPAYQTAQADPMANLDFAFGDMNFASEEAEENLSVYSIEDKNLPPHVLHVWCDQSGYQRISIHVHCFSSMTIGSYFPSITKDGWKVVLKMKWHPYILDAKKCYLHLKNEWQGVYV